MAKKKIIMTEGKRNIIASLLQEYDIKTAEDIQEDLTERARFPLRLITNDLMERSVILFDSSICQSLYCSAIPMKNKTQYNCEPGVLYQFLY